MGNKTQAKKVGPQKGDFVAPPPVDERDESKDALPAQEEFWRPPVRFGSVPVEKEPLGWDRRRGFAQRNDEENGLPSPFGSSLLLLQTMKRNCHLLAHRFVIGDPLRRA